MLARRGDNLLDLDRMLLHSPTIAEGWNAFFGAIRDNSVLDAVTRELVMCRVAALNGSLYEWEQHAPLLREALLGREKGHIAGSEHGVAGKETVSLVHALCLPKR